MKTNHTLYVQSPKNSIRHKGIDQVKSAYNEAGPSPLFD